MTDANRGRQLGLRAVSFGFRASDFGLLSALGLRPSDFLRAAFVLRTPLPGVRGRDTVWSVCFSNALGSAMQKERA
jgi:hypothetical protein